MSRVYSDKQLQLLQLWQNNKLKRINILEGSVRSGKTWISLVLWAFWVATMPENGNYLMVAKTLTSLRRNCLDLLQTLVGTKNFTYSLSKKEGRLFGRLIYLEGVNDARAESKIRGMTLTGAYCDELTLFTEDFFTMLLSRLSMADAKMIGTTNPDSPNHWLMTKYIKRQDELDMLVMKFLIEDNFALDSAYVENLKREYVGVFYDRFILGLWVVAEGAVYKVFSDDPDKYLTEDPDYDFIQIGVDFGGNRSAHTFVATGIKNDYSKLTALMSERHDAKGLSPDDLYNLLQRFIDTVSQKYGNPAILYADSAEQTLINGIRSRFNITVKNSIKNPIIDRIRGATSLMAQGKFFMTADCNTLKEAFMQAVYDEKKLDDTRLDDGTSDIDTLDAFEYSWERYLRHYVRE